MKRLLALAALLAGCRLSDPFYAMRALKADEPHPGESLLYGEVEFEPGPFGAPEIDTVGFDRVAPRTGEEPTVSQDILFRAFQRPAVKDGRFVIALPPGVYELVELRSSGFFYRDAIWRLDEEGRLASRITITRPGVYDLGRLRIVGDGWSRPYRLESVPGGSAEERRARIRAVVAGTGWEGRP